MSRHITNLSKKFTQNCCTRTLTLTRFLSTQEYVDRRYHLFTLEKKRQLEKVGRVEKIEVQYKGIPNDCTLVMNKDISTPYDCARHLSEWHIDTSALALLNGTVYWDMHKPLTENCTLELQNFTVPDPHQVNRAFWRTCSFMLGACASVAFRDTVPVKLHSFPGPDIRSGSFIYDIDLPTLSDWKPTQQEMVTLAAEFIKLLRQNTPLERLEVGTELALEMFVDNEHKTKQIPNIAAGNNDKVILYRSGKHVDISKGPMISTTGQIGRVSIASVHKIKDVDGVKQLYRFQGVALPKGVMIDHFAFSILKNRAMKLNTTRQRFTQREQKEPQTVSAQV